MTVFHVEHNQNIFPQMQKTLYILIFDNSGIRKEEARLFLMVFYLRSSAESSETLCEKQKQKQAEFCTPTISNSTTTF